MLLIPALLILLEHVYVVQGRASVSRTRAKLTRRLDLFASVSFYYFDDCKHDSRR